MKSTTHGNGGEAYCFRHPECGMATSSNTRLSVASRPSQVIREDSSGWHSLFHVSNKTTRSSRVDVGIGYDAFACQWSSLASVATPASLAAILKSIQHETIASADGKVPGDFADSSRTLHATCETEQTSRSNHCLLTDMHEAFPPAGRPQRTHEASKIAKW